MTMSVTSIVFYVNGRRYVESNVDPKTTLANYLRENLKLTGTKIGCNEGGCGACTVMISEVSVDEKKPRHFSANACLYPVAALHGKAVTTVEGIGSTAKRKMHPIQERLSSAHGSQCGYCTPGFVMAMYSLLRNHPNPTHDQINLALQGNLCRCTGYRPILEAFYSFTLNEQTGTLQKPNKVQSECSMGQNCCMKRTTPGYTGGERKQKINLSDMTQFPQYDPTQELLFPAELSLNNYESQYLIYEHEKTRWYQPSTYEQLLELKATYPSARLISGNSEVGVELKFRFISLDVIINPRQVKDLYEKKIENNEMVIGAGLSLSQINDYLKTSIEQLDDDKTHVLKSIQNMLHWFAGQHVRNVATVAGNIATASPISDLNPIWMACGASVILDSRANGPRRVPINHEFFTGYRRTIMNKDEIIKQVVVPLTNSSTYFAAYKQAQRREDDIAIVTGAFWAQIDSKRNIVEDIRISYGGMAPVTKMALKTASLLKNRELNNDWLESGIKSLAEEMALPADVPGGMPQYRLALAIGFFFKFYCKITSGKDELAEIPMPHQKLNATQLYQEVLEGQPEQDPLGRPVKHRSGDKHTTGEAVYVDDIDVADCLHLAFVMSPTACGILNGYDAKESLKMKGVVGILDANDVVSGAQLGHHSDTPVFVSKDITFFGQPIAAIVATDHETAREAAAKVKLEITKKQPIVTINDALEANTFISPHFVLHSSLNEKNDSAKEFAECSQIVEGSIDIGGQEHFYLETQQCLAKASEGDEIDVIISNQCVNDVHIEIAKCTGIPQHKINVKVKRVGGGFGGKESTGAILAVPCVLGSLKFGKPVKIKLERFDDMAITGTRHPFRLQYKVGLDEQYKLANLKFTALSNCGHTIDLSMGVMQRAMVHADNCYKFANADIFGKMCRTNLASNTAFRGFGGPQGMFGCEIMMKHISEQLQIDHDKFREDNFYEEGDMTPFGMHLMQCNIRRTWDECKHVSEYETRKNEVVKFNKLHRYRKRGIYLTPTRFGIGFGLKQLNQAGALVLIYVDGTVLVSHGGMEMGQGLHTKIIQIAARCLGVPIEKVHINDTATDKVPNASATAASVGSDMNGLAVQDACLKLTERLAPFKKANPDGTWEDWVKAAYVERVSLAATGFGIIHHEPVDFFNGKGAELFGYCVYGTACCEVEVDCLTGDHRLLRTDIVMDVGESLNPAVDIGQIEGAFIQGYGLFTMEEIKIRPDGTRLTRGPGNYKIPSADDAPREFNVSLLGRSSNKMGIFSSKAIGEPPLFLGSCAFFAIREAVRAYRIEHGNDSSYFEFHSPATPERIRMACLNGDVVGKYIPKLPEKGSFIPWTQSV